MALLDTVKTAKRIKHDRLDDDILRLIETAKAEMIRAGVKREVVAAGGSLVNQAVVTFCLQNMEKDKDLADRYERAFALQTDHIRKSEDLGMPDEPEQTPDEAEPTEGEDV